MGTGRARAAWEEIAQLLSVQGKPEPASANVLSEHEIEGLDKMTPQSQAQLLLERSINHYRGANDQIATRVDSWRGKIKLDQSLNSLFTTPSTPTIYACGRRRSKSISHAATWERVRLRSTGSSQTRMSESRGRAPTRSGT